MDMIAITPSPSEASVPNTTCPSSMDNNGTNSPESESEFFQHALWHLEPSHAIPYIILTGLAITLGVCGNLLTIFIFLRTKSLNKMGNELFVNLALADLWVTGLADVLCLLGKSHDPDLTLFHS